MYIVNDTLIIPSGYTFKPKEFKKKLLDMFSVAAFLSFDEQSLVIRGNYIEIRKSGEYYVCKDSLSIALNGNVAKKYNPLYGLHDFLQFHSERSKVIRKKNVILITRGFITRGELQALNVRAFNFKSSVCADPSRDEEFFWIQGYGVRFYGDETKYFVRFFVYLKVTKKGPVAQFFNTEEELIRFAMKSV